MELSQATRRWVLAYGEAARAVSLYNYGAADSTTIAPTAGHRRGRVVSPGDARRAYPTPQIYYKANARQAFSWPCTGYPHHEKPCGSCRSSPSMPPILDLHMAAWYRTDRMNSDLRTSQTIPFSTDISMEQLGRGNTRYVRSKGDRDAERRRRPNFGRWGVRGGRKPASTAAAAKSATEFAPRPVPAKPIPQRAKDPSHKPPLPPSLTASPRHHRERPSPAAATLRDPESVASQTG